MDGQGILLVVSGPSGVGKGTICSGLLRNHPDISYSVSVTTRQPRPGERDGEDYFFISRQRFACMRDQGELLEWAEVFGNYYGTPRAQVMQRLQAGENVMLEIDTQGALQVKSSYPECVMVFIWPPSYRELERRIVGRGTETPETLQLRLHDARREMQRVINYDYVVVNRPGRVNEAIRDLEAIIQAERARVDRQIAWLRQALQEV
ncbi:MAG: guanylate kinase [Bacillota bacterium]|jgi:guanylate kinase